MRISDWSSDVCSSDLRKIGRFQEADGGTLFLDEIGEMPLDAQVKLLRVLQSGEVQALGARHIREVDVRVIAATNKRLLDEVEAGRFREDLYYRSEEHTSELQSLMRISYAVFCLKKKTN